MYREVERTTSHRRSLEMYYLEVEVQAQYGCRNRRMKQIQIIVFVDLLVARGRRVYLGAGNCRFS